MGNTQNTLNENTGSGHDMNSQLKCPNSVVLMTDQHRVDTIGCLGSDSAYTPNLDDFLSEGLGFTKAFTPTAICTPARASILTGKAPFRHRVLANHEWNIAYCADITPQQWTYSQFLRDNGYNVGIVGKFHAGEKHLPNEFGYDDDSFAGAINPVANPRYTEWISQKGFDRVEIKDPIQGILPGDRPGHLIAARIQLPVEATFERFITEIAISRLRQYAKEYKENGKPFTLDVHYFGPHLPYIIPDQYFDLIDPETITLPPSFDDDLAEKPRIQSNYATYWSTDSFTNDQWKKIIAVYRGYVSMIDAEIGLIREEMKSLGLCDSTAVFFTADHGEFTGAHRMNDKGPAMYEDIYNIPLIARIPGISQPGQCDALVSILDVPATILDLAGFDPGIIQDGKSLLELVGRTKAESGSTIISDNTRNLVEPGEVVTNLNSTENIDIDTGDSDTLETRKNNILDTTQVGSWRESIILEFHGHHFPYQQRAIRTHKYKLIFNPADVNEFYDLESDPYEIENLWNDSTYDNVRRELAKELHRQLVERGDGVFAKWMNAMMDYDVPLGGTSNSDYDDVQLKQE